MIVTYDNFGRMKYCPELHPNKGKAWSEDELDYLVNWYSIIGPEEMSLALGRTITSVITMAVRLKIKTEGYTRRMQKEPTSLADEVSR